MQKYIPDINVGDRVRVSRPGWETMTGKVTRNDAQCCEIARDDIPPARVTENKGGTIKTLRVKEEPYTILLFGEQEEEKNTLKAKIPIKVEKIS